MKLTAEQRIQWLRVVWQHFLAKAGASRPMANTEYHVAATWLDRGLPLVVVLRAIDDFAGTPRRLEALRDCVDDAASYHARALGGMTEPPL